MRKKESKFSQILIFPESGTFRQLTYGKNLWMKRLSVNENKVKIMFLKLFI